MFHAALRAPSLHGEATVNHDSQRISLKFKLNIMLCQSQSTRYGQGSSTCQVNGSDLHKTQNIVNFRLEANQMSDTVWCKLKLQEFYI